MGGDSQLGHAFEVRAAAPEANGRRVSGERRADGEERVRCEGRSRGAAGSGPCLTPLLSLISVSAEGRAIEVTPGREIVWEYDNPFRTGDKNELVATLYQAVRLPADTAIAQWASERPPD